jgi:intracellular multiplication protein IcmT
MWRNTALPVRVFVLDGRACIPILVTVVYWSWTTLYIGLIGAAFFGIISWFGLTVPAVVRVVRRWLVGAMRPAVPVWRRRRLA